MMERGRRYRRMGHITGRRPDVRDLPVDEDVEREIRVHIEQKTEELIAGGWDREKAGEEALRLFGDAGQIGAECREVSHSRDRRLRLGNLLQNVRFDIRFGMRQLLRRPGLALIIMLTLAVGIGPNVALFSVFKAFLLEPFPYPAPNRLVQVWGTTIGYRSHSPFSVPDYYDYRERNASFEEMGLYTGESFNFGSGEPELIAGIVGTASTLRVFDVQPALGRLFTEAEEEPGAGRVLILSDALWKRRFDADPRIVGKTVVVNGAAHEIIGVMPADFEFLSPWYTGGSEYELWAPIRVPRANLSRDSHSYLVVGRLKEGVRFGAAEAEVRAIAAQLAEEYPGSNARDSAWLQPFVWEVARSGIDLLLILIGVVGLVLLVACANVAGMLLARGAGRQGEVAIRTSIGASKNRIVGQLLTESMMLSVLAGIAGVLIAYWSLDLLVEMLPADMHRTSGIAMDNWVLVFAVGLTFLTGIVFGLSPALTASRTNIVAALKSTGTGFGGGKARNRLLQRLTIAQLAVALLLLNGAILLLLTQRNLTEVPLLFDTERVLTAEIWLNNAAYEEGPLKAVFSERLIERLEAHPEVARAAITSKLPLQGGTNGTILVEGETYDPEQRRPLIEWSYVTEGYFETMGIRLLSGRGLRNGEGSWEERITVVNRAFAENYWPGEDAVGQLLRYNGDPSPWSAVIVGIVESTRQWGLAYNPSPEMYFPYSENPRLLVRVALRSHGDPMALVPILRREVRELDPGIALSRIRTMGEIVTSSTLAQRSLTLLVDLFALITLILATAGIYGTISYQVAQRMQEIGIRTALGAARADLLKMVLWQALKLVMIAVAIGIVVSIEAGIIFRSMIFGVSPFNPLYPAAGALVVALIAVIASGIPAIRATRVNPVRALNSE